MSDPKHTSDDESSTNSFKAVRAAGPLLGAGIQMAAAVVLMFFVGRWLDSKFGTDPWLMITGIMFGVAGGLTSFIRTASRVDNVGKKKSTTE